MFLFLTTFQMLHGQKRHFKFDLILTWGTFDFLLTCLLRFGIFLGTYFSLLFAIWVRFTTWNFLQKTSNFSYLCIILISQVLSLSRYSGAKLSLSEELSSLLLASIIVYTPILVITYNLKQKDWLVTMLYSNIFF